MDRRNVIKGLAGASVGAGMLGANRESTLEKEIEEAMAQGYEIVGSANRVGEHIAFLERPVPK